MTDESIVLFMEITGETSTDVAINYLTVSEGNTDQAIALYMESGGLFTAAAQTRSVEPAAISNMEWQEPLEERAPIPVRQEQLLDHFDHDEFMMRNHLNGRIKTF